MERESTQTVLGLDGCPAGWCAVALDVSDAGIAVHPPVIRSFAEALASDAAVIAVDIPIGLLDVPGPRSCDIEARRLLGRPRASSVFPAPSRRALALCGSADGYRPASDLNFRLTGRRLTRQSFNIGSKVKQVDDAITPADQSRVYEVHPEVCFAALAGSPMHHSKRRREGREERWATLRRALPALPPAPQLPPALRAACAVDDYIDATVAAWTAACILRDKARRIPESPQHDARGLRMEIWLPA